MYFKKPKYISKSKNNRDLIEKKACGKPPSKNIQKNKIKIYKKYTKSKIDRDLIEKKECGKPPSNP